ncbi:NAD(P)-dependent oxidoreductase [Mycolicibacterium sp. P9-64]|uniref:NAD(P)-dependent oxidoreductase n=1 Tax=Mycolicibacterium sp. P9-64 TaxID=2024612 RepID=UPI0011F004F2|nr:NAD(P)-dependent oxidoreductase [Mycolicibacterium sp. P9-64]KAA0086671.1 NAD(P)-dependent oxidoreductase [Mycolicibacterium sp. P9-64]
MTTEQATPSHDVIVIGAGAMGMPMAQRLRANGLDVAVVDPSPTAREDALTRDLSAYPDVSVMPSSGVVLVTVATGPQLIEAAAKGAARDSASFELWVICSTVGPAAASESAAVLTSAGFRVVDTPMTGGVPGAQSGALHFLAAGDCDAIDEAKRVLSVLGTTTDVGERIGDGQSMKLVNQLCCAVHLTAAAEAVALAVNLGLDPAKAVQVINSGAGTSWFAQERGPRMADFTTTPDVRTRLAILEKDSGLVEAEAGARGARTPLLNAAREQYLLAAELGLLESDDSQIVHAYLS